MVKRSTWVARWKLCKDVSLPVVVVIGMRISRLVVSWHSVGLIPSTTKTPLDTFLSLFLVTGNLAWISKSYSCLSHEMRWYMFVLCVLIGLFLGSQLGGLPSAKMGVRPLLTPALLC